MPILKKASQSISPRLGAILQALLVTVLWSTSWPLIKVGLSEGLRPLTFAGVRYMLAAVLLWLTMAGRGWVRRSASDGQKEVYGLEWTKIGWAYLIILSVLSFSVPQGAQFMALNYMPTTDVSLLMNFAVVVTALLSAWLVHEPPTLAQALGILLALAAALGYFYPFGFSREETLGVVAMLVGVVAIAAQAVWTRGLMRDGTVSALWLTCNTMTIGSALLLAVGLLVEGVPDLTLRGVGIVVYLAVVNTAFTFTLWNYTLRALTATEQAVIANTMLIQIALLAWLTLGERPTPFQVICLIMVALGTAWVQLRGREVETGRVAVR